MEYNFRAIEKKWQDEWIQSQAYKVSNQSSKPKFYVLDMFPYPSGAGLHVGHPLGYIASDIFSRYKRLKGFNVLHPMGYDAFGLPAEQYAIEHGIHPAVSTENNINNFRKQLDNIGFSYDWDREVRTSDPSYYKWTQWIFLQLFHSFFNRTSNRAEHLTVLLEAFENEGNLVHTMPNEKFVIPGKTGNSFTSADWHGFEDKAKQAILMEYRLAYCGYGEVNWCEALGTVLANDEVVNGVSERGGHPVVRKKLRQWYLRITEYADRLQGDLDTVDWSEAMKEMQTNWIGKSYGAEIEFEIGFSSGQEDRLTPASPPGEEPEPASESTNSPDISRPLDGEAPLSARRGAGGEAQSESVLKLKVYTTRPDTIFGVDFMVVAPENELVEQIKSGDQVAAVDEYVAYVKSRSERERQAEKKITGCFTGAYALNPFNGVKIPIWISEYVLAGYGTGAIMAVPCGDERDYKFAKHFNIPITNIIGDAFNGEDANSTKDAKLSNSGFLDGIVMLDAIGIVNMKIEEMGIGKAKVNYRMRDAAFSRQRYWGEPFPIKWHDGVASALPESELPLLLPEVDSYSPGPEGEGPLANIPEWVAKELETNTMPGYAGSSWYFLRYMDPHNDQAFCDRAVSDYWNQVDLYIGGTEHAVGHLLYSRMWTKALYDLGFIGFNEPFKKLLNQGMIQGSSRFVYRIAGTTNQFVSAGKKEGYDLQPIHVDVNLVDGVELDIESFRKWKPEFEDAEFVFEDGTFSLSCSLGALKDMKYICGAEVEKMSKSKFNTVNPDELVVKYGADTFRMYEMFLGPVEVSKPWDTKGIEGVHRFLKKLWRLFFDEAKGKVWNEAEPTAVELKVLHKTIKKIEEDTERFSFNTAVSAFMIAVNDLMDLKCGKKAILEPLVIMLVPYAPHIAEELYHALGNNTLAIDAAFPIFEEKYIAESAKEYPVSINGRVRTTMNFALDAEQPEVEQSVLANELVQKWMEGKPHKKVIYVKGRMINVVV
ncbi:MAG: class I tRNA ligase family protein [Bacteroidota bacterium]